ncbi:MAG: hypothetical protein IT544_00850 [Rhodobacteraceae bacterium]|nr:hypothetical protein [Paracoccaceae bacterium]
MLQEKRTGDFDLDGTLVNISANFMAAANAFFRSLGHGDMLGADNTPTVFHGGESM